MAERRSKKIHVKTETAAITIHVLNNAVTRFRANIRCVYSLTQPYLLRPRARASLFELTYGINKAKCQLLVDPIQYAVKYIEVAVLNNQFSPTIFIFYHDFSSKPLG